MSGYATCHVGKRHLNDKFNDLAHPQPGDHGYEHWMATRPALRRTDTMTTRGGRAVSTHFQRLVLQSSSDVSTEDTVFEQPGDCGEVRFRPFADRAEVGRPLRESTDFPR